MSERDQVIKVLTNMPLGISGNLSMKEKHVIADRIDEIYRSQIGQLQLRVEDYRREMVRDIAEKSSLQSQLTAEKLKGEALRGLLQGALTEINLL